MMPRKSRRSMRRSPFHHSRTEPLSSVFFDEGKESGKIGWAVKWKGEVLEPRFLSARTAQGHLNSKHDELLKGGTQ